MGKNEREIPDDKWLMKNKRHYTKNNQCIDCGCLITNYADRCSRCVRKTDETRRKMSESRKGKYMGSNHPRWKGGIGKTKNYSTKSKRQTWYNKNRKKCANDLKPKLFMVSGVYTPSEESAKEWLYPG